MINLEIKSDSARAALRRKQVLDAAAACFRQRGFHATSIAQIAMEAGMSVGHIYRYFTNKEEIIGGIFRQNLEEAHAMFTQVEEAADFQAALQRCMERGVDKAFDPQYAALMTEVKAEAARNEKLASLLRAADTEMRLHISRMIARAAPETLTQPELAIRADMLSLIFEGLPLRVISNPGLDRAALLEMVSRMIASIMQSCADG